MESLEYMHSIPYTYFTCGVPFPVMHWPTSIQTETIVFKMVEGDKIKALSLYLFRKECTTSEIFEFFLP